ncbi:MAG: hypothetical protein EXS35_03350 [Pedosphaera sp.]|nr:hypothetical protein [Pedosphaera sp.]
MASLWQIDGTKWVRQPLSGSHAVLGAHPEMPVRTLAALAAADGPAVLGCYARGELPPLWALLGAAEAHVWVNGQPLAGGLRVLRDRDEILIAGRTRFYFSTEELAKVEPFTAGEHPVFCARCRQPIQSGTPAVRCPGCGHWCEQSEAKPCWTYGPTCPLCDQPTAFDTGLRWTPEEL